MSYESDQFDAVVRRCIQHLEEEKQECIARFDRRIRDLEERLVGDVSLKRPKPMTRRGPQREKTCRTFITEFFKAEGGAWTASALMNAIRERGWKSNSRTEDLKIATVYSNLTRCPEFEKLEDKTWRLTDVSTKKEGDSSTPQRPDSDSADGGGHEVREGHHPGPGGLGEEGGDRD